MLLEEREKKEMLVWCGWLTRRPRKAKEDGERERKDDVFDSPAPRVVQ